MSNNYDKYTYDWDEVDMLDIDIITGEERQVNKRYTVLVDGDLHILRVVAEEVNHG